MRWWGRGDLKNWCRRGILLRNFCRDCAAPTALVFFGEPSQRSRGGLTSAAPPALDRKCDGAERRFLCGVQSGESVAAVFGTQADFAATSMAH
jgi:hypothetical protein